jgi:hypothetical protein
MGTCLRVPFEVKTVCVCMQVMECCCVGSFSTRQRDLHDHSPQMLCDCTFRVHTGHGL